MIGPDRDPAPLARLARETADRLENTNLDEPLAAAGAVAYAAGVLRSLAAAIEPTSRRPVTRGRDRLEFTPDPNPPGAPGVGEGR
ncbi:MAG: hypothetical protein L0H64_17605 [Pseudonocardia sp.]|nr:hypothetical protein [Pseudonocardia sp.]